MKAFFLALSAVLIWSSAWADKKVTISASPSQAVIYLVGPDGKESQIGVGTAQIKVDKDEPAKIVVRLEGYKPLYKTYTMNKGTDLPKEDKLVLEDRQVKVVVQPYDARILVNGVDQGNNTTLVDVKKDATVTVEVKKPGYFTRTVNYSNRNGMNVPPVNEFITLNDRAMLVRTSRADVQVFVNGKKAGESNSKVVTPVNSCVTVEYVTEGFVTLEKQYCSKEGQPAPPISKSITLKESRLP
jgi:hypothetical protein